MSRIPNVRVILWQWTNVCDKRFPNYIKKSGGKTYEKDANSQKKFRDNSAYVRFKGHIRVNINTNICDDRNITEMRSSQSPNKYPQGVLVLVVLRIDRTCTYCYLFQVASC